LTGIQLIKKQQKSALELLPMLFILEDEKLILILWPKTIKTVFKCDNIEDLSFIYDR